MLTKKPAVVIDNGSRNIQAGFACDNHPVAIFRSVVGRPAYLNGRYGKVGSFYDVLVGDEAMSKIDEYELFNPIVNGRIVDWDNMERVWHHIFYRELKAAPEDRNVVLSCATTCPLSEKVKCCEVFFEVLNSPALVVQPKSTLALYGAGAHTGIVVDIGYGSIEVTPIYQGGPITYAFMNPGYDSKYISDWIKWKLARRGIDLGPMADTYMDEIMRRIIYLTKNSAMARYGYERYYITPEGQVVDVSQEAFLAPELFFNPDLIEQPVKPYMSLTDTVVTSVLKCDSDLRSELLSTVVLAGGNSMIPELGARLEADLTYKTKKTVRVHSTSESYAITWLGGAVFAGMKEAQKQFVTKQQFEEIGDNAMLTKFIKAKFL